MPSLKVDTSGIKNIAKAFEDPALRAELMDIPKRRDVAAVVAQGIAANFDEQGPGWPALKHREGMALQKTNMLKGSVTTPGARGNIYHTEGTNLIWGTNLIYARLHNRGGVVTPKNAKALFIPISDKGRFRGPQKDPAAQKKSGLKYGKDFVFCQKVVIPARPFLLLREFWMQQLRGYIAGIAKDAIFKRFGGSTK